MSKSARETSREFSRSLTHPALALICKQDAAFVMTVLTLCFPDGDASISTDRMHGVLQQAFDEIHGEADDDETRPSPREMCESWLKGESRWLTKYTEPKSGAEHYRLTDAAAESLAFIAALHRERATMTGSSVRALLDSARECALRASTKVSDKKHRLQLRRDALVEELDRVDREIEDLETSGVVVAEPDAEIRNDFLHVRAQLETLLRDLQRVADVVRSESDRLRSDFHNDERPTGEIIDEYLQRLSVLMSATQEGRGFEDARRMLEDPSTRRYLREDLTTILAHPFAENLDADERSAFRKIPSRIHHGAGDVFDARTSINRSFTSYVQSRHAMQRRSLPRAIKAAEAALAQWEAEHSRRDRIPFEWPLSRTQVATLRTRPGAANEFEPPPLLEKQSSEPIVVDLDQLRARGGPHYAQLIESLTALLAEQPSAAGPKVFAQLPETSQRPADLVGLLIMAGGADALTESDRSDDYITVRNDGSTQRFLTPAVDFTDVPGTSSNDDEEQGAA